MIHGLRSAYESLPAPAKSLVARGVRVMPVRMRYGKAFAEELSVVRKSFQDRAYAGAIVRERLRQVFLSARSSPFWRQHLADVRPWEYSDVLAALEAIEPIDKEHLRVSADDMRSALWSPRNSKFVTTGGTTGAQVGFWLEKDASLRDWAHVIDSWRRVGFRLDEPRIVLRGVRFGDDRKREVVHFEPVRRELYISPFDIEPQHYDEIFSAMAKFRARFLHGYPSAMETLAKAYISSSMSPPRFTALLAVSENLYADQRAFLEQVYGARVFSFYGLSERCCFASECEDSTELHVHDVYGLVELLDGSGAPIKEPGVTGEIVATSLLNTTAPLIRYRTGDYAMLSEGECGCGRAGLRLASVKGRWTREHLVGRAGNPIYMTAINVHSPRLARVARYRFVQELAGEAVLLLQPAPGFSDDDREAILREFRSKLDGQVELTARVVEEIPLSPRGKHLFIDQRIPTDA